MFQAQPKDGERPQNIKPRVLPNEDEWKNILKAVTDCKENSQNCKKGQPSLSRVFAMSVMPRMDLENFKITKSAVNLILHMHETPVKKNKTSRRLNLKESLESYNSRRLQQQQDGEEPTPATKKKPYTQLCEVPWILHVEENGEMVEKAYYHPK